MFTDRRANSLITRRVPQPWDKARTFKILSIDGGGIKGVYAAQLLRQCQAIFCGGTPVRQFFDLIAGTSTGGIISLGLGLGLTTEAICDFYQTDGRQIFPPLPKSTAGSWWRFARGLQSPVLNHAELEEALKRCFGDALLGESESRLVIPAFMVPKTEIAVFKTDHHADFKNDHLTPAWKVARATSAAPTYLKGLEHTESGRVFLDGGVWANNPVMVALTDALSAFDLGFEQISVLSIGSGNPPFVIPAQQAQGGIFAWREVIRAAMFLTTDNATAQAKLLLGPDRCLRIEPSGTAAAIEMDDYNAAYAMLPELAARDFAAHRDSLAPFFEDVVQPRERHYRRAHRH